jgi:hypothetical protein
MNSSSPIDFLCIGAQKAGTSWLMFNLSFHPSVWTPKFVKELHYFDCLYLNTAKKRIIQAYIKRGASWCGDDPGRISYFGQIVDPSTAFTDEWYRHIFSFAPTGALKGECTPLYCALGNEGINHIKKLSPKLKIIYLVRDPIQRMLSSLRMSMERRRITDGQDLYSLLDNPLFRARGDYAHNMPRWESIFGKENILYIPFGKIKTDPSSLMRQVEAHLGINSFSNYPRLKQVVHPTSKTGIDISENILNRIEKIVEPQYAFLKQRFSSEFNQLIC